MLCCASKREVLKEIKKSRVNKVEILNMELQIGLFIIVGFLYAQYSPQYSKVSIFQRKNNIPLQSWFYSFLILSKPISNPNKNRKL